MLVQPALCFGVSTMGVRPITGRMAHGSSPKGNPTSKTTTPQYHRKEPLNFWAHVHESRDSTIMLHKIRGEGKLWLCPRGSDVASCGQIQMEQWLCCTCTKLKQ